MNTMELGQKMVQMVNGGQASETAFVEEFFTDATVSIEGSGSDEMPARLEGLEAIRGKHEWFYANHTIHAFTASGPYVGNRDDQFAVQFQADVETAAGERSQMMEIGLYTVKDGKIAQEEFLYLMS